MTLLIQAAPAFGFLGGKEVKEAGIGNLGLHDREHTANTRFSFMF